MKRDEQKLFFEVTTCNPFFDAVIMYPGNPNFIKLAKLAVLLNNFNITLNFMKCFHDLLTCYNIVYRFTCSCGASYIRQTQFDRSYRIGSCFMTDVDHLFTIK